MIEKNNSSILGDNYIPLRLKYRIQTFISRLDTNCNLPKVLLLYFCGMLLCNASINISSKIPLVYWSLSFLCYCSVD